VLFCWCIVDTCASKFLLKLLNGGPSFLDAIQDGLWYDDGSIDVVALLGLSYVQAMLDGISLSRVLGLLHKSVIEKNVTCFSLDIVDASTIYV